jgi:putative transposase
VALTRRGFPFGLEHDSVLPPVWEAAMTAPGLAIRADVASAPELRRLAKTEPRRRTAQRMLALANALDGMSRADAARAAGIERQALRDAVLRFNAEGLAGLVDRPMAADLSASARGEQAVPVNHILRGPDPEQGEPSSWTLPDLCRFIEERFGKTMCPQSMSRVMRRLGLSKQKARPVHPQRDAKAAETFAKRSYGAADG